MTTPQSAVETTHGTWALRYASHLGYRSADLPLFRHLVSSGSVVDHVRFAAQLGFAGIQYALARTRSLKEQADVASTARQFGLQVGCVVYAPYDVVGRLCPGILGSTTEGDFFDEIERGLETAVRVGSRSLVVLGSADPTAAHMPQLDIFTERLSKASMLAGRAGVTLLLEPLTSAILPAQILRRLDEAISVIEAVTSPNLRLVFDTAHVQACEGNAAAEFERVYRHVALLQLADCPGRLEPGSGEVDFRRILRASVVRGFAGLVELEHHWSSDTALAEQQGISYLQAMNQESTSNLADRDGP